MAYRLFSSILYLASLAMLLLVLGFILAKMGLGGLTSIAYWLAVRLILLCFALLLSLAIVTMLRTVYKELNSYFVAELIALRKLLAAQSDIHQHQQLQTFKTRQLYYFAELKRQRLLATDNKKQLKQLFNAIQQELHTARQQLPDNHYQNCLKQLNRYYRQANSQAMLALREQIQACLH